MRPIYVERSTRPSDSSRELAKRNEAPTASPCANASTGRSTAVPDRERSIERHLCAGQGHGPRPDRHGHRRGHARSSNSRPLSGWGQYDDEAPGRRHRHRDRCRRTGVPYDVHRQRRDRQGRLAAADVDQEARPGPADRRGERPRGDLPRRLRRRVPAAPGRDLPRQGPLRRLVLPPGPTVGDGPAPAVRRARRMHGRRRLRPGAVRRGDHGRGHRPDLPRRPADREGRARRDHRARRPRRRAAPHLHLRRQRLHRPERGRGVRQAARDLRDHVASAGSTIGKPWVDWTPDPSRRPTTSSEMYGDHLAPTTASRSTATEIIARMVDGSTLPRVQARLGRFDRLPGSPGSTATSSASSPTTASSSPSRPSRPPTSSSCASNAGSRSCSSRTRRATWSAVTPRPAASPRTAPRWSPRSPTPPCPRYTVLIGGSVRCRQLRHVRPRFQPPLPVRLAQLADRDDVGRDGRRPCWSTSGWPA